MKKIIKIPLIILGVIVVLFIGLMLLPTSSSDALNASDLTGEELESFLNSKLRWGVEELNYTGIVNEIFYSGNQANNFNIGMPKYIGKDGDSSSIAIIIQENDKPVTEANTVIYFKYSKEKESSVENINQLNNGKNISLGMRLNEIQGINEMNDALVQIYPDSFFSEYKTKWLDLVHVKVEKINENEREKERKKAEELAASRTPEGWDKDSIYNSVLFLRPGILDFGEETVGRIFYLGNNKNNIVVNPPKRSGRFQVISIVSTVNSAKFDVYLIYNSDSQISLIDKIVVKNGKKSETVSTFEDKYMAMMVILSLLVN